MGDLASPTRRDVADRLRERIKQYRRRDGDASGRFHNFYAPTVYENERQDTLLLNQRWQDSKSKKSSKSTTRPNREPTSNQQIQQRLKRKLESTSSTDASAADQYKFDDPLSPPPKAQCTQQQQQQPQQQQQQSQQHQSQQHQSQQHQSQQHQSQQQQQSNAGYTDPQSQSSHCVSVNIVQQINSAPRNLNSEIKINVQSTVHTSQCTTASTSTEIKTNICKEEPKDSSSTPSNCGPGLSTNPASQGSYSESIGLDDVDELQQILDALEKEEGVISPELMLAVENKLEVDTTRDGLHLQNDSSTDNLRQGSGAQNTPQNANSQPEFTKASPNSFYGAVPSTDNRLHNTNKDTQHRRGMYAEPYNTPAQANNANYGNMGAAANCMSGYPASPTGPSTPTGTAVPSLPPMGEPGPAAETLKQMAAQHQSNEYKPSYGAYGPEGYSESMARRPGYPPGYNMQGGYLGGAQNGTYPYSHQMTGRVPYTPQAQNAMPGGTAMPGASVTGQSPRTPVQHPMPGHSPHSMPSQSPETMKPNPPYTKPLTHYSQTPRGSTSPSSLQQLQDQVKTQFNQGSHPQMSDNQMQFSQSQQMRMAHPGMHVSQTQRMQFHAQGNQNISVAQQQSFNMSYNGNNARSMTQQQQQQQQSQYDHMRMRKMYQEKMMREQEMRRMQQQYSSGPPPPEYPSNPGSNSNPLQTMQSMVEQTNHGSDARSAMYSAGSMKQEPTPRHSMPASVPQRTAPLQVPVAPQAHVAPQAPSFPTQAVGNTAATSQTTTAHSTTNSTDVKSDSSNYTSAIMRGQRPPNVNVGPDGLNISQPRMPGWSRPVAGSQMGPMMAGPHPGMHYAGYGNQSNMNMHGQARMHMSQQQAMHMQRQMSGGHPGIPQGHPGVPQGHPGIPQGHPSSMQPASMSHQQQIMLSQQQQLHMQNGHVMSSMTQGNAMSSRTVQGHPPQGQSYPHPHTHSGNQPNTTPNYALDFLDNPQASNPDFFESVVQSNNPEFNLFDDILSGK